VNLGINVVVVVVVSDVVVVVSEVGKIVSEVVVVVVSEVVVVNLGKIVVEVVDNFLEVAIVVEVEEGFLLVSGKSLLVLISTRRIIITMTRRTGTI
jgi:hypothetical protein